MLSIRVHRSAVQAHAYGCASTGASLVPAEIPQSNVLRRVVIRVILVTAFQTLKLLTLAVVRVCEPTR